MKGSEVVCEYGGLCQKKISVSEQIRAMSEVVIGGEGLVGSRVWEP